MFNEEKILMLDAVEIGVRIREARKEKGIKSVDLAAQLGISADQYSRIETGKSSCNLKNLFLISQYLEVSSDYLLSGKKYFDAFPKIMAILNGKSERDIERAKRVLEAVFM